MEPQALATRLRDRLEQSRFLTVSLTLHAILVLILGMAVVTKLPKEQPDFAATGPLVEPAVTVNKPVDPVSPPTSKTEDFQPSATGSTPTELIDQIVKKSQDFTGQIVGVPPVLPGPIVGGGSISKTPIIETIPQGLSKQELRDIGEFTKWRTNKQGESKPKYEFTAYIGRYSGNWNSTVRISNGEIAAGSLPNLLYVTSKWTDDQIKTNERRVQAIPLDSDELISTRPPFVFLTGTRDFRLTDREVENLRRYIRLGGAIWGDSSVPGQRSAFDNAFRREMERVVGNKDAGFEALAPNHEVLTRGYFSKMRELPSGLNNYREPVKVLKWNGEIAVIHTSNDYGDMWQIGLDKDGKIDLSRNEAGQYVAMNQMLWENRGVYVRNIEQPAVENAYKFGINMIFHLLTRWESRVSNSAPL